MLKTHFYFHAHDYLSVSKKHIDVTIETLCSFCEILKQLRYDNKFILCTKLLKITYLTQNYRHLFYAPASYKATS